MKPVIAVKEARKLLGKQANDMTDVEVEKLIDDLDVLARYAIKHFKASKLDELNPES